MLDSDIIVNGLIGEWHAIDSLISGFDEARWNAPSSCPGWTVRDIVAHITGTELSLAGENPPRPDIDVRELPHVHNEIGAANEAWVRYFRDRTPGQLLDRFREVTARRAATLRAMSADDFDAPSWTPAGQATYRRFMQIRVFDCWMHEQDIREAVGVPGGEDSTAARIAIDEISTSLGYVVGKRGKAPDGSAISFELTGPNARTLHIQVDGRARVVAALSSDATVTISMPTLTFSRLCGGRVSPDAVRADITSTGDLDLARHIVDTLAYTI